MNWEHILLEEDYSLYRRNITLLEEQVIHHFPEFHQTPEILTAIRNVPRHMFVNRSYRYMAYTDNAIPNESPVDFSFEVVPMPTEAELEALIAVLLMSRSTQSEPEPTRAMSRWTRAGRLEGLARRTRPLDSGWKR